MLPADVRARSDYCAERIRVRVYSEGMCPDCITFWKDHLPLLVGDALGKHVDFNYYSWGNSYYLVEGCQASEKEVYYFGLTGKSQFADHKLRTSHISISGSFYITIFPFPRFSISSWPLLRRSSVFVSRIAGSRLAGSRSHYVRPSSCSSKLRPALWAIGRPSAERDSMLI